MKLSGALQEQQIIPCLQAQSCWEAIEELVNHLVDTEAISIFAKEAVLDGLKARESENGTGVGDAVAIPHCFIEEIQEPTIAFGRSSEGVEFECPDSQPVEFIILLLMPSSKKGQCHLQALAEIARILHLGEIRNQLRHAENSAAILKVFSDLEDTVPPKS